MVQSVFHLHIFSLYLISYITLITVPVCGVTLSVHPHRET
jgi:hypothetical protein